MHYDLVVTVPLVDPILVDIPTVLRGERVTVRLLNDEDAEALFEAIGQSREHLARWMPWAKDHLSVADSLKYIRRSKAEWLLRTRLPVNIFESATGRLVGGSGLERIDWGLRSFEIGYWLRVGAEGQGYTQETVRLLARMAFSQLAANRVQIIMDPRNVRSERVAQRAGFQFEGTLRHTSLDWTGAPANRQVYALTPEAYRKLEWAAEL